LDELEKNPVGNSFSFERRDGITIERWDLAQLPYACNDDLVAHTGLDHFEDLPNRRMLERRVCLGKSRTTCQNDVKTNGRRNKP
jgi:hypothetical protein